MFKKSIHGNYSAKIQIVFEIRKRLRKDFREKEKKMRKNEEWERGVFLFCQEILPKFNTSKRNNLEKSRGGLGAFCYLAREFLLPAQRDNTSCPERYYFSLIKVRPRLRWNYGSFQVKKRLFSAKNQVFFGRKENGRTTTD